jgi:hypothetical protein
MKKLISILFVLCFCVSCGDDPNPVRLSDNDVVEISDEDEEEDEIEDDEKDDDVSETSDNCADTKGLSCTTDTDCGNCMICVKGGRCAKGCKNDDDCLGFIGTKCNTKLARCLNIYGSNKICGETNCPTGCCYAEKGLSGLKCEKNATPTICGLCSLGEIFSPEESKCISAVCSTTTDNCPSINSSSSNPPSKCFKCDSELICKANTTSSGCSAGSVINATQCVPAGQNCVEGISECCSGMPCVQGYCY